jgi:hypothetical protein
MTLQWLCKTHDSPGFSVLIATGVVLFQSPSHTSPNCPCPNLRTNFRELRSISHWSRVLWDRPLVIGFSICAHNVTLQHANQHSSRLHSFKWSTRALSHSWFLKEPTFTGKTTKPTRVILHSECLQSVCEQNAGDKQTVCSLLLIQRPGKHSSCGTHDTSLHCNSCMLRHNGHRGTVHTLSAMLLTKLCTCLLFVYMCCVDILNEV